MKEIKFGPLSIEFEDKNRNTKKRPKEEVNNEKELTTKKVIPESEIETTEKEIPHIPLTKRLSEKKNYCSLCKRKMNPKNGEQVMF